MSLFKKKENRAKVHSVEISDASVKILGGGCAKCNALEDAVREALRQMGKEVPICHVKDFGEIAAYGVMQTPALVVDEKVISYGKVLKAEEAAVLLKKAWEMDK